MMSRNARLLIAGIGIVTFVILAYLIIPRSPPLPETRSAVEGVVIDAQGSPLQFVRVHFCPHPFPKKVPPGGVIMPLGVTDTEGKFSVTLDGAGVPPGVYKVLLMAAPQHAKVPEEYSDPDKTPWQLTVTSKGANHLRLQVK